MRKTYRGYFQRRSERFRKGGNEVETEKGGRPEKAHGQEQCKSGNWGWLTIPANVVVSVPDNEGRVALRLILPHPRGLLGRSADVEVCCDIKHGSVQYQ